MRAIVQHAYGPAERVLRLAEVDPPTVGEGEVLVRVRAASVNAGDWRGVTGSPLLVRLSGGLRRPKNPGVGVDAAGVIEAVGTGVTRLAVGDAVYGMHQGAFAELVAGTAFVPKPANLSFEEAAAVPAAGCTALQALRDQGQLRPGERVLVNGAGGGVGTFTVQVAKALGAADVTAVTSTANLQMVRSIGADEVLDYTTTDPWTGARRFDLIVDCGGTPTVAAFRRTLAPGGRMVLLAAGKGRFGVMGRFIGGKLRARLKQPVIVFIASPPFTENLATLAAFIEAGTVRPVIERTYPLAETAAAIRHVQSERAQGKVVIRID